MCLYDGKIMTKRAFTLVEILVSVVLLAMISLFVSSLTYQTTKNNKIYENSVKKDLKLEKVVDALYRDIIQLLSINVKSYDRYSVLQMKSKNSIHGIEEPYVTWLVLKQNDTLIRLESAKQIVLPIKQELKHRIFIDRVISDCKNFSVNLSKNKNSILVFLQVKKQEYTVVEVPILNN